MAGKKGGRETKKTTPIGARGKKRKKKNKLHSPLGKSLGWGQGGKSH